MAQGFDKLTLNDLEVRSRRVFVRVDFNVPLRDGVVSDDTRIVASLPTLRHLVEKGARVVLASHLGRPKGVDPSQSLRPAALCLAARIGKPVAFASDCIGPVPLAAVAALADGEILLLENLRFHPEEEKNDDDFARALASLADIYVNDAFGSAHRAHASTEGITRHLPRCAAGLLMEKELAYLGNAVEAPMRPFVAILGGSKISGKIDVIRNLLQKVDRLLIGGAMMFTFLRARDHATGRSLVEEDRIPLAKSLLDGDGAEKIVLPIDTRVARSVDGSDAGMMTSIHAIPPDRFGVDIGTESIRRFVQEIERARTVLWNGPMGIFEVPAYAEGTLAVARALAAATSNGATTIIGGGDSAAAANLAGVVSAVSHVSTGGGASLEFLEGKTLPGVAALHARR